ncbi:MAG: hypothetical protein ACRDPG_03125 [Nocardioidaceae bacterium]
MTMFNSTRRRSLLLAAGIGVTALVGSSGVAVATPSPSTGQVPAAASATVPTVVAHMGRAIHLSVGESMRAGRVIFRVVTKHGNHELQLLRLHRGYSIQEASVDFGKAFQGNVPAVRRLDNNITFLGGASATPTRPGKFSVTLRKGRYVAVDQDSNALAMLRVFGTNAKRPTVPTNVGITVFTYGFALSRATLPRSGWAHVVDRSDQPHFIEFNRVKTSTTNQMVRKYFNSGGQTRPSFGLRISTGMGVLSPTRSEMFHYNLPPGKYLMACYWPDDETGMPHAFMGMWKLVRVS